jgi:hypothetical protein
MNTQPEDISYKTITLDSPEEWTISLNEIPFSPAHKWDYCHAMRLSSNLDTYLLVFERKTRKERCVIPLSVRKKEHDKIDLVSPYGFGGFAGSPELLASAALKKAFFDYCLSHGVITAYIQQHPSSPLPTSIWGQHTETTHEIYQLDLTTEIDILWKNMSKGHKYALKKSKIGVDCHIEHNHSKLKERFKELYPQTLKRTKASAVYHFPEKTLDILLNSPNSLLLGIKDSKEIQAISLFLYTEKAGEYFLNATTEIGRNYSRHLVWLAMKKFIEMNIRTLNLGGGVTKNDSLADFKKRFGGHCFPGQTLKIIFSQQVFHELCSKYCKETPYPPTYFPPYWQ